MSEGGPGLALLARLSEAAHWDDKIRRHEDDPWAYLRRKLLAAEGPLRELKTNLFRDARKRLLEDLAKSFLPPGSIQAHKETLETLLTLHDFADISFHLEVGGDPQSRLQGARDVLDRAQILTLFDKEALPPERRDPSWNKRVEDAGLRLHLDDLTVLALAGDAGPGRKALLAHRLRGELDEALALTRSEVGLREEITPFVLERLETMTAAALRFLARWR